MRAARQPRDHVVRGDDLRLHRVVGVQAFALQFHRLELARLRLLLQRFEIQPGAFEQVHRQVALDPAFQRRMRGLGIVADHVEHAVGVGTGDRGPAVGGRRGLVHDQHAGRALPRALLVLVGPAPVVGHALAVERALAGLEVRVVDQHHRDLALQVHALEVVPAAFRRLDPVADEHQRRAVDGDLAAAVERGAQRDLLALGQRLALAVALDRDLRAADDVGAAQRHRLRPQALAVLEVAARLQAGGLELRAEVGHGLVLARRGRGAALVGVGGQRLDVGGNALRVEPRRGRRRRHQCAGDRQGQHAHDRSLHAYPSEKWRRPSVTMPAAGGYARRKACPAPARGFHHGIGAARGGPRGQAMLLCRQSRRTPRQPADHGRPRPATPRLGRLRLAPLSENAPCPRPGMPASSAACWPRR